ncbi:MAG: nitroreductase [Actinomycetota bacterium]|nr:nitroreductase [Actinomycetota bacterium]
MSPNLDPQAWRELARTRRSIRDFRPDPIPADLLDAVVEDALTAPSWSNTQPYRLAIASGDRADRLRNTLAERFDESAPLRRGGLAAKARALVTRRGLPDSDFAIPLAYPDELQQRRRATGFGLYGVLGIERHDYPARERQMRRNFEFFGAPTAIFAFVHDGLGTYSVLDAGFLLQNLLLAAHARGLGTCAQGALATWAGPVRTEFEVPDHYRLVCGVSIGYPSAHAVNGYDPGRPTPADILLPPRL